MSQADRALIVIHRGDSGFGRLRYHRVTIDGRLAGYTARVSPTTELSVDPGVHTVEVAICGSFNNRIASLLVKDYWTLWILEPMSGSVSGSRSPGAG
jgi:hypothetical protein